MPNSVYKLKRATDDPRFDGFVFADEGSMLGFDSIEEDLIEYVPQKADWKPRRLASVWQPRAVKGRVLPINDFPTVNQIPAFSERAVDAIRDMLEHNGELLPLKPQPGNAVYHLYNVTTVGNVLDVAHSDLSSYVTNNHRYEFFSEKLKGLTIFRIPEVPDEVFVTEAFAARVRERGLQGFHLMKVWPLPPGVDWYKLAMQELSRMPGRPGAKSAEPKSVKPQKIGKVSSRPPAPGEELDSLQKAIRAYQESLGINTAAMTVDEVQKWIFDALNTVRASKKMTKDQKIDRAFWLGIAWGETLVRQLAWEWVMLQDEGNHTTLAVASPNRSYAVPALQFIENLATKPKADLTSQLLYNMIKDNDLSPTGPGVLKLLG